MAALFVDLDGTRPVPSIERALSGPDSQGDLSWRRRVKVVSGGQGPGQRDREMLDRERVRQPLAGPRLITVLGCTSGAGQSITALMTGHILASVREVPVAALDLYPGETSLASRVRPATSVAALLAARDPDAQDLASPGGGSARSGSRLRRVRGDSGARLDVIAASPVGGSAPALSTDEYWRLAGVLAERYPLTLVDPAPAGLTRVLALADQLVLVVPAGPNAPTSLANTQQWLSAHGYDELAARAVTVVNGVRQRATQDVLGAESVARGRCRAIVRVPWDELLSPGPGGYGGTGSPAVRRGGLGGAIFPGITLRPQTRLAYTALAGVLVASLSPAAAGPGTSAPGRSPGEHSD